MKKTDKPIADHFEDVLDMVEIGEGSCQPYDQIVGLDAAVSSQPVTICHGFKGWGKLPPPLLQSLDSALGKFRRARLESRRRGH